MFENFNLSCWDIDETVCWYAEPSHHGEENLKLHVQALFFCWSLPGLLFPHVFSVGCVFKMSLQLTLGNIWKLFSFLFLFWLFSFYSSISPFLPLLACGAVLPLPVPEFIPFCFRVRDRITIFVLRMPGKSGSCCFRTVVVRLAVRQSIGLWRGREGRESEQVLWAK